MTERRRAGLLLTCLAGLAGPVGAQSLAARMDALLEQPAFNRLLWGVSVRDSTGAVLYARNAERLFMPASNTKLLVAATAAALLPPDGTVRTSVYGGGPVRDGVLDGDLVLYGRGDPTMSRRCFGADTLLPGACTTDPFAGLADLARQVAARGVRTVGGDLIGDGSWFESTLVHPTWETGDLAWWYAAPVSGLSVNDNSVDLTIAPGAAPGAPAQLAAAPSLPEFLVENRTRTVAAGAAVTFDLFRIPGTWTVVAVGDVPADARPRTVYVAVPDPNRYAALLFREALRAEGIAVLGATRATTDSTVAAPARRTTPLAELESRPFRAWLFPILNTSQNLFAEMLLKQLGRLHGGDGSWAHGLEVERRFLIDSVGLDSTQFAPRDGSGLSANNLVTPAALTALLTWIRRHPRWEVFAAGLPRNGEAGSLRARLARPEDGLTGRVAAKTGSISSVNTLSGYVEDPRGDVLVFSIQANHHTLGGRGMVMGIDSLVAALARGRGQ